MFQKKTLYDIFKLRILLYFVVPIVLAAIIIIANHQLNSQQYHKMYNEFYINYTDEVFVNMDEEINTIVQMDYWLKNDGVKRIFESDSDITDQDAGAAMKHMRKMKDDFDIIDSILIINRKADSVVATNGKATLDRYFGDICKYQEYNATYFKDIRYPVESTIKLPPTAVEGSDDITRYVMPIIKMASMNENTNSFFVFNISLEKLMGTHTTSKYTENTSFWFVNKKDKQFYSAGGKAISIDEKIWDKIDFDEKMQNYEDGMGNRYCVFTKTVSPSLMDYAYLVFIPINDVSRAVSDITLKIVLISIFIYLITVMIVLFLASDMGKTFAVLIKTLNFTEQVEMKEIFRVTDKISKEFSKILDENSSMKLEIKNMMGDVKEKMITDVLNNKNRQVKMSLYKYDNFLPINFCIIPEKEMNENILISIEEQLYSALRKYFDGMYEAYEISNLDGNVNFVLNVPQSLNISTLENEIKKLAEIVSRNEINVKFEYRIGEICDSLEDLRDEYLKLCGNRNEKAGMGAEEFGNNKYIYRVSEHNSIINSILEGDNNKTIADIDRILITNVVNDVSQEDMKVLYQNIINTIITALKMKKVDVDKLINDIGSDTYFGISEKSETEVSLFIMDLIKGIDSCQLEDSGEKMIADIIAYVGENYSDYSLTLESVAKQFGVDAKNLSKQFKKYSHITFHKYLTELKIEEAKRLLITTDLSIEQIYNKVGYVSRTTFMRAFGSVEELTPSEYRKKARG